MKQIDKLIKSLYHQLNSEVFRYIVAGGTTTLVNIIVFFLMRRLDLGIAVANGAAFIIAVVWAFFLNEHYVFTMRKKGKTYQRMTKFVSMRIGSFVVDTALLVILIDYLFVNDLMSKVIVNIVVVVLNYMISKYFIYNSGDSEG